MRNSTVTYVDVDVDVDGGVVGDMVLLRSSGFPMVAYGFVWFVCPWLTDDLVLVFM